MKSQPSTALKLIKVNKNEPHPSKGWGSISVGDLVYYGSTVNRKQRGTDCYMAIVLHIHGTAAVIFSYLSKKEVLIRTNYLQRVEI